MKKEKISKIINVILTIGLVVVATIIYTKRANYKPDFSLVDMTLEVTCANEFSYSVKYEDIKSFTYLEEFDKGENIDGKTTSGTSYGTYKNNDYESYNLCIIDKVEAYICLINKDNEILVFNYNSKKETKDIYDNLYEYFTEHGYLE